MMIRAKAFLITTLRMQVVYVWYQLWPREPPDKPEGLFPEGVAKENGYHPSCFDTKVDLDHQLVLEMPNMEANDSNISVSSNITDSTTSDTEFSWNYFKKNIAQPRSIRLNIAITNVNARFFNVAGQFDSQSMCFVMDTGSSDHICRHKHMFDGGITPLRGVKLQGVGGVIEAKGYGTVAFTVHDDDGVAHAFNVHNVLHVSEAPMNLLSPQKWIAGFSNAERLARGAMSVTMGSAHDQPYNSQKSR